VNQATDPSPTPIQEHPVNEPVTIDPGTAVPGRRRFFSAVGALSAAAVLAACGDDDEEAATESDPSPTTEGDDGSTTTTTTTAGGGDVAIAELAAGLEILAVNTYGAALDAANAGDLGTVPPAVAEFATTARDNHQAHLDAWNEVVTSNGGEEVTSPPSDLEEMINTRFAEVTDIPGLGMLAYDLEQIAADTYLSVLPTLSPESRKLAGSIQATDRQHQAILLYALGEYPVPDAFQGTDNAVPPS
jgi:hypothetical protein